MTKTNSLFSHPESNNSAPSSTSFSIRVRSAFPILVVISIITGFICYGFAFRNLSLAIRDIVIAIVGVSIFIWPIGHMIIKWINPVGICSCEKFLLQWLIGYPLASGFYYFLALLKVDYLFPVIVIILSVNILGNAWREGALQNFRTALYNRKRTMTSPHWLLLGLLGLIILVITRGNAAFTPVEGGLAYRHSPDNLVHLSFYWELLRGILPHELPYASGISFPQYHILPYMLGVVLVKYGHLDVFQMYHAVMPIVNLTLFIFGIYIVMYRLSKSYHLVYATLVAIFFVMSPLQLILGKRIDWESGAFQPTFQVFLRHVSVSGGFIIWTTIACLLVYYDQFKKEPGNEGLASRFLYLTAVLVGLSYFFKAQMFIPAGGAFFFAMLFILTRDRKAELLYALILTGFVFCTLYLSWRTESPHRILLMQGLYAKTYVFPALKNDPSPFIHTTLMNIIQSLPNRWEILVATQLGVWRSLNFSVLIPIYYVFQLRRFRRLGLLDMFLIVFLPLIVIMTNCIVNVRDYGADIPLQKGIYSTDFVREANFILPVLVTAIDISVLSIILNRLRRDGEKWTVCIVLVLALILFPITIRIPVHDAFRELIKITISPGELGALKYLREETAQDAVVIDNRKDSYPDQGVTLWNREAIVAGLGGRRSVYEYFPYPKVIDPQHNRKKDIQTLYTTPNAQVAWEILRRYGISYILEYASLPLKFPKDELETVYESPDVIIFHVPG
jgi:hypothetical protein